MDFASGGTSDEQRNGPVPAGGIVSPKTWRLLGRGDVPESYVPFSGGTRSLAILQRMIDGPTEEERAVRAIELAERQRAEAVGRRQRKIRHMALVSMHEGIVRQLLEEHAPHEHEDRGSVYESCHGCAEGHDGEQGEYYQSWPCPTWQTISDATP